MKNSSIRRFLLFGSTFVMVFAAIFGAIFLGLTFNLSKSDWASWVQAIGSIGAILVALAIVQLQHSRELKRLSEADRTQRRGQIAVLLWVFHRVAETCDSIADKVGSEDTAWHVEAAVLDERRKTLSAFPLTGYPDQALLLTAQDVLHHLQMARVLVEAMAMPRRESTQRHIASVLHATRDIAMLGVAEATDLLGKNSTKAELSRDWELSEARGRNYKQALKLWSEIAETKIKKKREDSKTV